MPSDVSLHLIGVWFCVGFFTSLGWAIGAWAWARLTRIFDRPGP